MSFVPIAKLPAVALSHIDAPWWLSPFVTGSA
jgi:hypothetical protein